MQSGIYEFLLSEKEAEDYISAIKKNRRLIGGQQTAMGYNTENSRLMLIWWYPNGVRGYVFIGDAGGQSPRI